MNIYESLNKIMHELPAIPKAHKVEYGRTKYNFRGIDDIYSALQPFLIKHKVISVPEVLSSTHKQVDIKDGVANQAILTVRYRFYAEDGTFVDSCVVGEALDSSDKASNKAMSAAHKYALLQIFSIPTEEAKDTELSNHEVEKKTFTPYGGSGLGSRDNQNISAPSSPPYTEEAPWPESQNEPNDVGNFVIEFGKFKTLTVEQAMRQNSPTKLLSYADWLESDANVKKKPLSNKAQDTIHAIRAYAEGMEIPKDKNLTQKIDRLKNEFGIDQEENLPF